MTRKVAITLTKELLDIAINGNLNNLVLRMKSVMNYIENEPLDYESNWW